MLPEPSLVEIPTKKCPRRSQGHFFVGLRSGLRSGFAGPQTGAFYYSNNQSNAPALSLDLKPASVTGNCSVSGTTPNIVHKPFAKVNVCVPAANEYACTLTAGMPAISMA